MDNLKSKAGFYEALIGFLALTELHLPGVHNQDTHGNDSKNTTKKVLDIESKKFSTFLEGEINSIIDDVDYESIKDVPTRGEALIYVLERIDDYTLPGERTKEEKSALKEIRKYLVEIGVYTEFREGKEFVTSGKGWDFMMNGKKYVWRTWKPLIGTQHLGGNELMSELHLQGQHDQKKHGNDVSSPPHKAKTKSVKPKKNAGIVEVGKQKWENDQPVYKVVSNGEEIFKDNIFRDEGLLLVGLKGEHKGVVLYTRPTTSHQDMLSAFDDNSTDIDWAHFYIEFNEDTGKEQLFIDAHYAGYDALAYDNIPMDEIYNNLHVAKKGLIKAGFSPDRIVSVLEPANEFKNRPHYEIALGELSADSNLLTELGAGVMVLSELQEEHSSDAMICFKIPDNIRAELKDKYPFVQDIDNLHITLIYLGDTRTLDAGSVVEAVTNWSTYQAPIKGKLQGIARFVNGEEVDPVVMTFDSKQMPEVYDILCDFLYAEKIEFHKEHGFIPHMTLAYITKDEDMPVQTIEPIEINFTSVWLAWNNEWVEIELSGVLNRLSWNADDFGVSELHLPGQHDQKTHGNEDAQEDEFSKILAANKRIREIVSDKWDGKKYFDRTAYKINGDGERMFVDKTGVSVARGTLLVGVKGKRRGEILYGRGFVHAELLHAAHDGDGSGTGSLDDYVHFYIKNESPEDGSGNEILSADLSYAGVALNYDYGNEEEWQEQIVEAHKNLYTANEYLVKIGVSKNRDVEIYEPRKFKPYKTKLEIQFSSFFDKLAEIGAGFLSLLGVESLKVKTK